MVVVIAKIFFQDLPVGSFLVKINATDKDIGNNAVLKFSLMHGTDGKFSIDALTGEISTVSYLDRETKSSYSVSFTFL